MGFSIQTGVQLSYQNCLTGQKIAFFGLPFDRLRGEQNHLHPVTFNNGTPTAISV